MAVGCEMGAAREWVDEMLGTTDPTLGTGEDISGDMEGIAASCESNVTSVAAVPLSPPLSLSPVEDKS